MESFRHNSGVTLVEIVVVVAVISLLVSIVLAAAVRLRNRDNEQLMRETFSLLDGALEEYFDYYGGFPVYGVGATPAERCEELLEALSWSAQSRKVLEQIGVRLMADKSPDPNQAPELYDAWGTVVDYNYSPGDNFPRLQSAGSDRIFNTPDDITNR